MYFYSQYRIGSIKNKFNKYPLLLSNILFSLLRNPSTVIMLLSKYWGHKEINSINKLNRILYFLRGKKLNYDIVHCHFGPNGNVATLLKEIGFLKGQIITTFHGYDMTEYIKKKGDQAYDRLFKVGDLFLPVSERWKNALVALGCNEDKIRVHRMGVDLSKVTTSSGTEQGESINCLTIGRFIEKKGIQYGIEAFSEAVKKHPNITYRIVGDGPLRIELEKLINDLDLNKNIELMGLKKQEDVFSLLSQSDILIAPSVTDKNGDQEGIPVVLMEGMAHGLPVISSLHSGISELVKDWESGFLVPERDTDLLTERLNYLIENPGVRRKMGNIGRDFVFENHNNAKLNRQLVQIYESILA